MGENSEKLTLLCVDSSQQSTGALEWYFENLHKKDYNIGLVHVHQPPDIVPFGLYSGGLVAIELYAQQVEESIRKSKAVIEKYKKIVAEKGIKDPTIFHKTLNGSIGHTIVTIANESKASLIVIGQRGIGPIRRTLFGSVSDYVLHHATIPVCVVPPV